jgi:hypothetical protein
MAVQPKAVILYAKIGSVYYPVACAKDVNVTTTADLLELAPRSSGVWKEYEYGRLSATISGSGITTINPSGNLYTIFDVLGQQLNQLKFLVKFSVQEETSYKVLEANVLVEECNIAGSSTTFSNYTYSLRVTGPVSVSSTEVANTNPQILVYEYTATGGEVSLTLPFGDNATILLVEYGSTGAIPVFIFPDGYGPGQVQYNPATKQMLFGTAMTAGLYIRILYVDVDSVVGTSLYLEDGTGDFIEDGTGAEITSG